MPLKVSELTEAIMEALGKEWERAKGAPLPAAGAEDRRILFAAVARGMLEYLESKEHQLIKKIELERGGARVEYQVRALDLDIKVGES